MIFRLTLILLFCSAQAYSQQVKPETFTYKTVGDTSLQLDVYYPANLKPGSKAPVVILFHGGGWTGGNRTSLARQSGYFAQRGLVAVTASYRLVKKGTAAYEKEFRNCIYDAKSAVRWVKLNAERLGADSTRLILGGGSAGGYLAVMAALDQEINDSADDLTVSTRADALVLFNPAFPKRAEVPLPFKQINAATPPTISFYGDGDSAWLPQGTVFDNLLSNAGVKSEFWIAAGQKHGFYNQEEWTYASLSKADHFLRSLGFIESPPSAGKHPEFILRKRSN